MQFHQNVEPKLPTHNTRIHMHSQVKDTMFDGK